MHINIRSVRTVFLLIFCIALPLFIGYIGSFFTMTGVSAWYQTLQKPWFNPPDWLFGPVWTILYMVMGISWWLVLRHGIEKHTVRRATVWFLLQLGVNLLWSYVFFAMQSLIGGLCVILILIVLILLTMHHFRSTSRAAVWLLIPYLCWTVFATLLNGMIFMLNHPW
ncbi:MAG TPA: tryptophan-rich sensory protein [Methanospirillum sp.]|uniref:TspO/MBR family protein n=1 Tax=Methanospirillum sp. TaxID=45200 RepID=UPI002C2D65F7|nr:TspO/MBR family protein [Methanospirillum sp.]HOJ95250.1 tryptophan-rich sensory protein [Methanospirillum sp.]HOL41269.1 tryptophan-rich sensory protein [Methanospirillum sp.]HPP77947.1 tryptophan-rich sensory protein [Methanospirillum sp.]